MTGPNRRLALLLALLLVLVAVHLWRLGREAAYRPLQVDDFIDLHTAWLISEGQTPWLQAFTNHPMLQSWPMSWLIRLGGGSVETQRWALWVVYVVDLAIFLLVSGHFLLQGRRGEAIVALFLITNSTLLLQHLGDIRPETFALLCLLIATELTVFSIPRGPALPGALGAGVFIGCACLMNQKCIYLIGAFVLFYFLAGPSKVAVRRSLLFSFGVVLTFGSFVIYLVRHGALEPFFQLNFVLPFKVPLPSLMWQKVMSVTFLGTMLSLNYFFVFCCLWGFKWGLSVLLGRTQPDPKSQAPSDPILWPDLPWPTEQRHERLLVSILAAVSLSFMALNPFPHLYNYLLIGPFLILMATPCVTSVLASFCARPKLSTIVLVAGFAIGDVALPLGVSRHSLDGHLQHREIARVHTLVVPGEAILDSSMRFYRPEPTNNVPIVAFTGILSTLGYLKPVAPDLIRTRCRFVFWDDLLDEFLLPSDKEFIRRNYVPLEGSLWVLGRRIAITPPGNRFLEADLEIPARYHLRLEPPDSVSGLERLEVDGQAVETGAPVVLDAGRRRFRLPRTAQALVLRAVSN